MLLVNAAGSLNKSEQAVVTALTGEQGLLLANLLLPGRRTLEVDAVVITPHGVATVEAKHSRMTGTLHAQPNGDWHVNDATVDFPGKANPTVQARNQAQVVQQLLNDAGMRQRAGKVRSLICVSGNGLVLPADQPWADVVADVTVTLPTGIARALRDKVPHRWNDQVTAEEALQIAQMLGMNPADLPSIADLAREGFYVPTAEDIARQARDRQWQAQLDASARQERDRQNHAAQQAAQARQKQAADLAAAEEHAAAQRESARLRADTVRRTRRRVTALIATAAAVAVVGGYLLDRANTQAFAEESAKAVYTRYADPVARACGAQPGPADTVTTNKYVAAPTMVVEQSVRGRIVGCTTAGLSAGSAAKILTEAGLTDVSADPGRPDDEALVSGSSPRVTVRLQWFAGQGVAVTVTSRTCESGPPDACL
jgi:hypothetical protein